MPLTNAESQARYRAKRDGRLKLRTEALEAIVESLKDNDRPLAEKIRVIACTALHG